MTTKNRADPTPEEWTSDIEDEFIENQGSSHHDPRFGDIKGIEPGLTWNWNMSVLESLSELRRSTGLNQTEIGERWGRGQSQVSKVERSPTNVELTTLMGYVRALGGQLTMTIEVDGHVYHEELVSADQFVGNGSHAVEGEEASGTASPCAGRQTRSVS